MSGLDHSEDPGKKSRELGEVGGRYWVDRQRGLQSVAEIEGQLGEDSETIHSRT